MPGLEVSRWGTLAVDHRTQMTSLPGVFGAGDIVRGASLVVWAIKDGRDAAARMHDYMQASRDGGRGGVSRSPPAARGSDRIANSLQSHPRPSPASGRGGRQRDVDMDFIADWNANAALLHDTYRPAGRARHACGVGLVASLDGRARRDVVQAGIDALKAVWHRGAVDADGKTGDGAGIHIEIPQDFFAEVIQRGGDALPHERIAVGQVFLPKTDLLAQERCRQIVETEILHFGHTIHGWRQVPIDVSCIGEKANATRPEIEQIMVRNGTGADEASFERDLYVIRRRIEKQAIAAQINELYICSLSCRSIIYKGMFLAANLTDFYPDLMDERFVSRFAIYHQRYSTNTFPTWRLAQPFRTLAHNGEINTLSGNVNWMKSHETRLWRPGARSLHRRHQAGHPGRQQRHGRARQRVRAAGARRAGRADGQGAADPRLDQRRRDDEAGAQGHVPLLQRGHGAVGRPGRDRRHGRAWMLAGLDRNGLRPLRYSDHRHRAAGGRVRGRHGEVRRAGHQAKGRVGPGQSIAVELATGKFYGDEEVKDMLAARHDYGAWTSRIRSIDHIVKTDAPEPSVLRGRGAAPPPAGRGHDAGGAGDDPAPDGGGRRRGGRLDG